MSDINYSDDSWYINMPSNNEHREIMFELFRKFGVKVHTYDYRAYRIIKSNSTNTLHLSNTAVHTTYHEVDIYEAITILTAPEKSERDVKLEELSKTVADAQEQIRKLQEGDK